MGSGERWFVALFGLFLLGLGLYVVLLDDTDPAWRFLGGLVLIALGANAAFGAVTNRRPWISRIGPLP
jgi:hypothetical protein